MMNTYLNESTLELKPLHLRLPQILVHFVSGSAENPYIVNLNQYTCSCPDWQIDRSNYHHLDVRRACKHISSFLQIMPFHWVLPVPHCNYKMSSIIIEGYTYVLKWKENNIWIDVIVKNRIGQFYDYGYNFDEKRWAYNTRPKHSKQIREMILNWLRVI